MAKKKKKFKRTILRIRAAFEGHPLRLYTPTRLADLFDVDQSTLHRWEKAGLVPKRITLPSGKRMWSENQLKSWLNELHADADRAEA
jgi:hypothetical protein